MYSTPPANSIHPFHFPHGVWILFKPSQEEGQEEAHTRENQRRGHAQVAGARYHSAVDRELVGRQSSRSSAGWRNTGVVVVAGRSSHRLRRRVVGSPVGSGEGFRGEGPSMLYRRRGGDRGCDGGGR